VLVVLSLALLCSFVGGDLQAKNKWKPGKIEMDNCSIVALDYLTSMPVKRVYEMVLCVYHLRREGYPFTLDVAGSPVDRERRYAWALECLVEELDLVNHVRFHGHVEDVASWLHDIDIFVSNSYWEGQQVALMEAMATGCYCLGHCWDGVEEMLPVENTFASDTELRTELLSYAALPDAEKQRLQAEMRAIVRARFDERRMVQEVTNLLEKASRV